MTIEIEKAVTEAKRTEGKDVPMALNVFVYIDLDGSSAVELAARCQAATTYGGSTRRESASFWLPTDIARRLFQGSGIADGSPQTIRIIACDSHGAKYHEAPAQP